VLAQFEHHRRNEKFETLSTKQGIAFNSSSPGHTRRPWGQRRLKSWICQKLEKRFAWALHYTKAGAPTWIIVPRLLAELKALIRWFIVPCSFAKKSRLKVLIHWFVTREKHRSLTEKYGAKLEPIIDPRGALPPVRHRPPLPATTTTSSGKSCHQYEFDSRRGTRPAVRDVPRAIAPWPHRLWRGDWKLAIGRAWALEHSSESGDATALRRHC
jgi:hypothetical protein